MRAPAPQPTPRSPHDPRARSRGLTHAVRWRVVAVALAMGIASVSGCKTGPDLAADYAQTARENYELSLAEFADEDWDESIQYADFVRIRFPFSRFAVEAELLIARAEFEQGNYLTAQDAFRQFSKLHPTHKHVRNGWVSYMAAVSAYMNGPQSFFLLPPDYQRDQSRLREALVELEYFFDHYGHTSSNENALELRDEINRRLLQHELYVARFYLDREKPEAAIGRLESAHARYPGIGLDAEVLFLLGVTYLRMEEVELSRSTFSELQAQHPKHHHGKQSKIYLRYIYDTYGPADPARKRPDRSPPVPVPPPLPKNRDRPERPDLVKPEGTEPPGEGAPGETKTKAKPKSSGKGKTKTETKTKASGKGKTETKASGETKTTPTEAGSPSGSNERAGSSESSPETETKIEESAEDPASSGEASPEG